MTAIMNWRNSARAAYLSAALTVVGFVTLIVFYAVGQPFGTLNDASSVALAICLLPVAAALHHLQAPSAPSLSRLALAIGWLGMLTLAVLPTLAETIAQTLKLPYVAIALQHASGNELEIAAAYGLPTSSAVRLPLTYQSERVGELLIAPRAPDEAFTPAEHRLLTDIAHQAGVAAHAVRLTADLQHSRERLVTAREEERRRLRRDLHDGLGPALAAHTLKVGSARALLARDPATAEKLLTELERDIEAALSDIRRLVYDLRPPALDELGLVGAIRESGARYHRDSLRVSVEAQAMLPALPAAVEVAAYRITQEALTNVVRHAQAHTCFIALTFNGELSLEIRDDGVGLAEDHHAGVGLTSMRERAAELGGTCVIEALPIGGTRILAQLPCRISEDL